MTLWLRVRRVGASAVTILAVGVALLLSGDIALPLPNLLGGPPLAVPFALLVPLAVGIVVAWGLTTGDPLAEAVASRPMRLLDVIYVLSVAIAALAVCMVIGTIGRTDLALAAGRNVLGYVGLTLVGRRVFSPLAAAVLPVGFAVMTSLFGRRMWWAWPLSPATDIRAWLFAILLLCFGAILALSTQPRSHH